MITFEITINQKRHAVVGICGDGVVSAILHDLKREGSSEISLNLGALEDRSDGKKINVSWADASLKEGDELTIRILKNDTCDAPERIVERNPIDELNQKREYLKQLQAELELLT